jgi:hypothetical protein
MYVLPNRKAFSDSITRIFLKYRNTNVDPLDTEEDLCLKRGGPINTRELFTYQKIVRDYLLMETPYRGLLLYHGLGSGKTCSSIAVAESLMSSKKVFIMTPASLQANYRSEIRKCGDPMYAFEQHWEGVSLSAENVEQARALGISQNFLDKNGRFFVTVSGRQPNYRTLSKDLQSGISSQIDDIIEQRFTFINYNGISATNVDKILPPDQPHIFDDSVIIIDEAHNLIGSVVNERLIKAKIYDMMYRSKNSKIVCLSGTPVINRPNEIAYLMNLLRGPIERISIPTKSAVSWDEGLMTAFFRGQKDVDTIEYNSVKRTFMLTRNPPYFDSVYNDKNERIAVKYNKDSKQNPDLKEWVQTWKTKFETQFAGVELADSERFVVENLQCLPTDFEEFMNTFVDGLSIKNPLMFARRIQGLVSYFKGADERLMPKRLDEDSTLVKVGMSDEQFLRYLQARFEEIQRESRQRLKSNAELNEDFGSFRMTSRLVCNYAIPPEMRVTGEETEETVIEKPEVLLAIKSDPARFLSPDALKRFSPKMAQMLTDITENVKGFRNQFVYSQYRSLEGLGVFGAVLEANGFQEYKLVKKQGVWEEAPMKEGVPAYAMYVGGNEEERELYRQIFNQDYSDTFPQSLKDSIKEHRLCVFMASSAGAEGITLADVRNVYIMEAYWNPARIDQVIGRAIRICSHRKLPLEERTVKVQLYLSVFTPEQSTTNEGFNIVSIRRNDTSLKRYEGGEPKQSFMSSDEYLYEVSYRKSRIIKNISLILKQSSIDCEIHRKLHSKEQPIIQCMRFDTTSTSEDLAFKSSYKSDERDTLYLRNVIRKARRLQKITAKGIPFILDPDTNEIFDFLAFEDTRRLLRLGIRSAPGEIRFFTSTLT